MPTVALSYPEKDIALLSLDMPDKAVNVLSVGVMDEIDSALGELEQRDDLAGLIIASGKPGSFVAGADVREFVQSADASKDVIEGTCQRGQQLFARFSKLNCVSVAAVDGVCLGGGAELAIWCDRRVFSNRDKTEYGFPEVKLGIFPGWGGTVRAPRILGVSNAVEMITGGESISAPQALQMGLCSDLVGPEELLNAAIREIRVQQESGRYLDDRRAWSGPVDITDTELGFLGATASAVIRQQTKGQYPAPDAALEVILEGSLLDADAACELEAKNMARLFGSEVNRALLNVFFLTDYNKKDTGVDEAATPRDVGTVGVVGAGIMGGGIAAASLRRGRNVVVTDASHEALGQGVQRILEEASFDRTVKRATTKLMGETAGRLNPSTADAEFASCDLIIEAVIENLDAKRAVYERLEPQLGDEALLASNTSTIPITTLAEKLKHPERFCGIHFFNPVRRMKLVEVIRGEKSSNDTIATAVNFVKKIGKMPVVVNDGPGFLVNRLLFPYMNESLELLRQGCSIKSVDRAAKSFGMPMGPIELYDMVGIDTACYAGKTMYEAFPDRIVVSPILPAMLKTGRLGRKSGSGFFSYDNPKKRPQPDKEFDKFLSQYLTDEKQLSNDEIVSRLFLPMLLEATRALQDQIVRDPRDVDLGLIFGLGFPPFQGGLLCWADRVGADKILSMLEPLQDLGERMQPTQMLQDLAASGNTFYP